jgi:hypothetical protein
MTRFIRKYQFRGQVYLSVAIYLVGLLLTTACSKENPTFSMLEDGIVFKQNSDRTTAKVDILWVIDNSGSMETSQNNVATNFASFINGFSSRGFDYQMAVITTDAYRALYQTNQSIARYRTGNPTTSTGVAVITPETPNLQSVFLTNITQGINGSGDERAFQSMQVALEHQLNSTYQFPRPDAFFAVIIISDEDDGSMDSPWIGAAPLYPTSQYLSFLDTFRGVNSTNRNYSVSAISIFSQACLDEASQGFAGRVIGTRYAELVDATGGIKAEICGNFSASLQNIAQGILELSTAFRLNRPAVPESIQVWVNNVRVPYNATNGFTYNAGAQSIYFHGNAIPPAGATIRVSFDPSEIR